jgi:hypothetical protein
MRESPRIVFWPTVIRAPLLILVSAAAAGAGECRPFWYDSLPRDDDWYYGAGKGADAEAARRDARENLAVQAIGGGADIPVEALAGWEQDDHGECRGDFYALVRIGKAGVRKELAALASRAGAKSGPGKTTAVEAALVYRGEDGRLRQVHEGMTLTSKHLYGLYLRPAQDCYAYIYQVDSQGTVARLFPNADFHTGGNFLREGEERWVPNDTRLFELDETNGTETIYIVASRRDLPALAGEMAQHKDDLQKQFKTLRLMSVKGAVVAAARRTRPLKGNPEDILTEQFKAAGNFYYKISFEHQ